MKKYMRAAALLLALALALAGCGAKEPPESYTAGESGEDTVPSLSVLVPTEEVQWSTEEGEDGTTSYRSTDLTSGAETAQTYTKALEDSYDFTALSQDGKEFLQEPDFSTDSGDILLAKESQSGSGLFQVALSWDKTSCTVTPSCDQEAQFPSEESSAMTLDEAAEYLKTFSPAVLGLEGADMSGYDVFPEEGVAMLDQVPCICLNVYRTGDHQYCATYLIAEPNRQVYRLDRNTGMASTVSSGRQSLSVS